MVVVGHAAEAVADRAADLEKRHGVRLDLVHNDRAEEWNNAYSLWLAREYFRAGRAAGQRRHRAPGQRGEDAAGRAQRPDGHPADVILALDTVKQLADEEMKVVLDERGAAASGSPS